MRIAESHAVRIFDGAGGTQQNSEGKVPVRQCSFVDRSVTQSPWLRPVHIEHYGRTHDGGNERRQDRPN